MRSRTTAVLALTTGALCASAPAAGAQPWQDAARTTSLAAAPAPSGAAPIVCVIDTGVNITPTLAGHVVARDTVTSNPSVDDGDYDPNQPGSGHGTYVAQTVASTWPHARVVSVRVAENGVAIASLYPQAIGVCRSFGASVINLSLSSDTPGDPDQATYLRNAVGKANDEGIDVVLSAGNSGGGVRYPANAVGDIATVVSAVGNTGAPCSFASTGPSVLLGAPGCPVELMGTDGQLRPQEGSSFSAPQVAAILAAVRGYAPSLDRSQRRAALSGLPGGVLDGDEVLRRIGRADLITTPAAAPAGTGAAGSSNSSPITPRPSRVPVATKKPRPPTISVRWSKRRIVIRALRATRRVHLTVRVGTRKTLLISSGPKLTVPRHLSKTRVRLVVRVIDRKANRLASRSLLAPRTKK